MATKSEVLLRDALGLPVAERADLAAELILSLEESIDDDPGAVRSLWGAEIERRARLVIAGEAPSRDWSVARQQLTDAIGE